MQKTKKINDSSKEENNEKKLEFKLLEKEEKIKFLENEINKLNEQYKNDLILKSKDAQNQINSKINEYKIKTDEEIKDIKKYAIKNSAIDLVNIINQFDSVVNSPVNDEKIKNYVTGFKMFLGMFENLLNSLGIYEITINENDDFNESCMEAVDIQIDQSKNENTVFKVLKKGYKLHEKVLSYAQVIVYKKK